jgi:pyruvate/2-oxoglutarate dehydrogenase complex dihydrolipoamide acyltransferase (E2) component
MARFHLTGTDTDEPTTVEVTMPETGSRDGATIVAWLKRPGDLVRTGESLCKVLWDDGAAEVESPADGVMRLVATAEGALARTGSTLAVVDLEGQPGRHGLRHLFR